MTAVLSPGTPGESGLLEVENPSVAEALGRGVVAGQAAEEDGVDAAGVLLAGV